MNIGWQNWSTVFFLKCHLLCLWQCMFFIAQFLYYIDVCNMISVNNNVLSQYCIA